MENSEWLKERQKCITGTDVGALMGVDQYRTPIDVYLDKLGISNQIKENNYMKMGKVLEPIISNLYEQESGYQVEPVGFIRQGVHGGTPDRKIIPNGILEIKSTQMTLDDPLLKWYYQTQWYAYLTKSEFISIAWLEHGLDFKYKSYEYDNETIENVIERVNKFWNDNILKQNPPEPVSIVDETKLYIHEEAGKIIESNEDIYNLYCRRKEILPTISELTKEKEAIDERIRAFIKDAEKLQFHGQILATYKANKESIRFDEARFRAENPDIYKTYISTISGARVLRCK